MKASRLFLRDMNENLQAMYKAQARLEKNKAVIEAIEKGGDVEIGEVKIWDPRSWMI